MVSIIYEFKVKANQSERFIESWRELTELIYEHENSLGSRLHKRDDHTYIAYALWPDLKTWKNSGNNLPQYADEVRQRMRAYCDEIKTLFELEIVEDLIKKN